MNDFYTIKETAALLKLSRQSIQRMLTYDKKTNKIKTHFEGAIKVQRDWLIPKNIVDKKVNDLLPRNS